MEYHLAQINIARMVGINIDDPIMQEFADNLDKVNALAEQSKGFVWRLKDESNNASAFNPYQDEQIIINISVWKDISSLEAFTYKTFHSDFLRRRKEWFVKYGEAHYALFWIEKGSTPSVEEAVDRLSYLQKHGPTERAFSFGRPFEP